MFRTRGFFFRMMFVGTVNVHFVINAEIRVTGFYKIPLPTRRKSPNFTKYNIFELLKYTDMNTK
jgi:hypothetical protein